MIPRWLANTHPDLLRDLLNYLHESGSPDLPDEAACKALRFWLDAMAAEQHGRPVPGVAPPHAMPPAPVRGYFWKWLFLPEGTRVRLLHGRDDAQAVVVGNRLMHKGGAISPNQFACGTRGGMRNAWRDLILLLPGEKIWKRPFALRREREQALAIVPASAVAPPAPPPRRRSLGDVPF
jgi:hypothetical protein